MHSGKIRLLSFRRARNGFGEGNGILDRHKSQAACLLPRDMHSDADK